MKLWQKLVVAAIVGVSIIGVLVSVSVGRNGAILNPAGQVALKERDLMLTAVALGMLVIIPVFIMAFSFAWRYRETNRNTYHPEWDHSTWLEVVWWGIPCLIILVLGTITWTSSHDLDPFKPLTSPVKPITIQVVSLQWKWLFIYPDEGIATVNHLAIPVDTPVHFVLTSDAPMNSFWIPQLGSQIYTMPGMSTELNLMASNPGTYNGVSANISGAGFADMSFKVYAMSSNDYASWRTTTKSARDALTRTSYQELALPGTTATPKDYTLADPNLYTETVMKYMTSTPQ